MRHRRIAIGFGMWALAVLGAAWYFVGWQDGLLRREVAPQLWRHATGAQQRVSVRLETPAPLAAGDPIYLVGPSGRARQVGEITAVYPSGIAAGTVASGAERAGLAQRADALFYESAPTLHERMHLEYHSTDDSLEWVLTTLLPPGKRAEIVAEIRRAFERHHEELAAELRPIVERALRDALLVVEDDLAAALLARRGELERLGAKYQGDVVEREIVPLVRAEIWPIVQQHAEPLADEIGAEMWERASLWRFGWRYAYDVLPFTRRELVRHEWRRFVRHDAAPVLQSHTREIIDVQQQILLDIARNRRVQQAVRTSLARILEDPELERLVWSIIAEVVVDNPRLHAALEHSWQNPETQQALSLAGQRLEPTVQRIVELVVGSRDDGVTPEFAHVLRSQVLGKDRRWLVVRGELLAESSGPRRGRSRSLVLDAVPGTPDTVHPAYDERLGDPVRS